MPQLIPPRWRTAVTAGGGRSLLAALTLMLVVGTALPPLRPVAEASVLAAAPPAQALTGPADGGTLTTFGPTLTWTNPPGTTQVHVQIIPANNDGTGLDTLLGSPATSLAVPAPPQWFGLLPGMGYTWRVRASNASGSVPLDDASWSPWAERTFRTPRTGSSMLAAAGFSKGELTAPEGITLQWASANPNVWYFEIEVSPDSQFRTGADAVASVWSNLVHGGVTSPPNSWRTPPLEPGTRYFWRVRPRVQGDGIPHAWGPTWNFVAMDPNMVVAYVVASVPPDRRNYFTRYEDAAAYVCANVAPNSRGMVIIETATSIPASALAPGCRTQVRTAPGGRATVQPDVGGAIDITGGALSFTGLEFAAPTTFTGTEIELVSNQVRGDLTVNLLPPGALPRLVGLASVAAAPGGCAGQTGHVASNRVDGGMEVKAGGGNTIASVINNTTASITAEAQHSDCFKFNAEFNVTDRLNVAVNASGQATVGVAGKVDGSLGVGITGTGVANVALKETLGATATLDVDVAEVEASVVDNAHQSLSGTLSAGRTDVKINHSNNADWNVKVRPKRDLATLMPVFSLQGSDMRVGASHQFEVADDLVDGECSGNVGMQVKTGAGVPVTGRVGCKTGVAILPGTELNGGADLAFSGRAAAATVDRVTASGNVQLDFALTEQIGGYVRADVSKVVYAAQPVDVQPNKLSVTGSGGLTFTPRLAAAARARPDAPQPRPHAITLMNVPPPDAPGRVVIEDVVMTPDPRSQQPAVVLAGLRDTAVSEVLVRNNRLDWQNPFALNISETNVPVTIEGNSIAGGGIYLYGDVEGMDSTGPITAPYRLRNNTLRPTLQGATALMVSNLLNVTATGNTIQAGAFPAVDGTQAIMVMPNAYVNFDGGNTITGNVMLNEGSFARFQGNTFSGAYISDLTFGRLVNDPVRNNSGLDPDLGIVTRVDFDGNGCAEYPTLFNAKANGQCALDGVPPPTPPALR